jgi:hypothetical protein
MSLGMVMLPPVAHLAAVQAPALRARRRLVAGRHHPARQLPLGDRSHVNDKIVQIVAEALLTATKIADPCSSARW